jgi:dihydrofolate reductase
MASFSGQPGAAMLFGHRTYDGLVGYWLSTTEENPFTAVLRDTPKYVVSRTPGTTLPHPNSHLLDGDPVVDVAKLREETDGEIIVLGSGTLVRTLAAAGLVDSYVLTILPVVLGTGTRLFEGTHARLEVVRSTTSPTGIVVATYAVVG